jgi:demethylmenaquinone methyltransferase/2-methoxy-6-polyprenyl-1,4-benzoquinol methylase
MTAERDPHGTVDFGFERVAPGEKTERVRRVFESVATRYDLMNDLMSLGVHRLWKRFALAQTGLRPGMRALDLGGGTGDLALALTEQVGPTGQVVLSDINAAMLEVGRGRLIDAGVAGNVEFVQADAEALPFADRSFDCVTIAFALRNVTDKDAALRSIHRVLKPGGRCLVLEFSTPAPLLKPAYDLYSFKVLPAMGRLVAGDRDSYRYLAESIRMHPDQETLKAMMERAGFDQVAYHDLSGGIVALHKGFKF